MERIHILRLLSIGVIFTCTGAQEDICGYTSLAVENSFRFGAVNPSQFSQDLACQCTVRVGNDTHAVFKADFRVRDGNDENADNGMDDEDEHCGPLMFVGESNSPAKGFYVCAARGMEDVSHHETSLRIMPGRPLFIHVQNPRQLTIDNDIRLESFQGSLSVDCMTTGTRVFTEGRCPCVRDGGMAGGISDEYSDYGNRLMIGLLCAFFFLLIVAAIVLGWYFYNKRKKGQEKTLNHNDANIVENQGFEGEKTPTKTAPQQGSKISYQPDPNLNLKVQTAPQTNANKGFRGSQDSGLASGQQSDMQPYATSTSLNNLNEGQQNWPPLAGQGSQTSLQNESPMTKGEVEALYAKPGRRESSQDAELPPAQQVPPPHQQQRQPHHPHPQQVQQPPHPQLVPQELYTPAISSEV